MTPRGFRAPPTTTGDKVSPEHAIADMADEESSEVMRALTDHVDTCVTPFEKTVMVRRRRQHPFIRTTKKKNPRVILYVYESAFCSNLFTVAPYRE